MAASIAPPTYHFKLNESLMALIVDFARTNYFVDRKVYKKNWAQFVEIHATLLAAERERLRALNFQGDVDDKFYKTGRHYFRNKDLSNSNDIHRQEKRKRKEEEEELPSKLKVPQKKTRTYIRISSTILAAMSKHASANILTTSPKVGYALFATEYQTLLLEEETRLTPFYGEDLALAAAEILERFKKSYKNFYNRCKRIQ
jgi:hypothetical protein